MTNVYDALRAVTVDEKGRYLFKDMLWLIVNSWLAGAGRPPVTMGACLNAVERAGYTVEGNRVLNISTPWWRRAATTN
ncbi:hypothetical protein ABZT45_36460 [Streptomyces sp. NPDC005356]|uniref:hypothetical protein n=1 Tax=Streptomyces sp. NPDC005356 TaxID=3157167 RepID=UPI00339EA2DC